MRRTKAKTEKLQRTINRELKKENEGEKVVEFFDSSYKNDNKRIDLKPLNINQSKYIKAINTSRIVVAIGSAGTSKTYCPSVIACNLLKEKKIEKIIICRPSEGPSKYLGHEPGTMLEKLENWVKPVSEIAQQVLGKACYQYYLKLGKIEYCCLYQIKGRTFKDAFVIIDEAEDLDIETTKSLLTRIGENAKVVINGDIKQQHIKKQSGLGYLTYLINKYDLNIPIIEFTLEDCVRSEITKMFIEVFEKEEDEGKK